jgi:hypothetical protein
MVQASKRACKLTKKEEGSLEHEHLEDSIKEEELDTPQLAGPGFVNVKWTPEYLLQAMQTMTQEAHNRVSVHEVGDKVENGSRLAVLLAHRLFFLSALLVPLRMIITMYLLLFS